MLPQEIIRKKRDKQKLSPDDIKEFVDGVAAKTVTEGQVAAFCMAVLLNKMDMDERVALTSAMARSGTVMDWSGENLPGPVLDKHSSGGVGDKVSLMLAPLVAAAGGYVPMLSGRGLGHTGGTLDKMDAIEGYKSQPDIELFKKTVRESGCAIIGATPDLAPADRIMYAIRDVTGTVESLDLITASILSKKLAAGLDGLVMDVTFGNGTFTRDLSGDYEGSLKNARDLGNSIHHVANGAGLATVVRLTDMNQVLGRTAGNALEVREAIDYLRNVNVDPRLHEVTVDLTAELLVLGKLAGDKRQAVDKVQKMLLSGKAAEHFAKMVKSLGGPSDLLEKPEKYLKTAPVVRDFHPDREIFLGAMNVFDIGIGIVELGGGRMRTTDVIDHSVGLSNMAQLEETVGPHGRPLATIHARSESDWQRMAQTLTEAVSPLSPSERRPTSRPVVLSL